MPPTIALMLCSGFVAFLLWLDQKQSRGVSLGVWIPTIWTLYCASRPVAGWFLSDVELVAVEEGSATDRLFLSILIVCGFVTLARGNLRWSEVLKENRWLVLLYAYMIVSILWSDYPWISFKRWIRAFGSLLMAVVVLNEPSPRAAIDAILRRSAYLLIPFSLLLIKYFPDLGVQYDRWLGQRMWVGVTTQKNSLGRLCLISIFFLVWAFYRRWQRGPIRFDKAQTWAELAVLAMALWLLKGPSIYAASATGITTLALGVSMFFALAWVKKHSRHTKFNFVTTTVMIGIGMGIAIPLVGGTLLGGLLALLGRDTTFTGRTDIWGVLLPIAWQHPVLGLGYGSFWVDPPVPWPDLRESHNGYVEVFLELGLVGILLLLAFLFSFCSNARRALIHQHFDWAAFGICLLLTALFHNITEASMVRASSHLWTVLLFLALLMPRLAEAKPNLKDGPAPRTGSRVNAPLKAKNLKPPAVPRSA